MFGFFSKKKVEVCAPIKGRIMDIIEVQDEVFASKMMGDGFAVEPKNDYITAPCDGRVVLIAGTKHAVAIEKEGVQMLIHIGLDTVELKGEGFTAHVKAGDEVKKGDKLISFDADYIKSQGKPLTTMLVITNMDEKVKSVEKTLKGEDIVMTIEVK